MVRIAHRTALTLVGPYLRGHPDDHSTDRNCSTEEPYERRATLALPYAFSAVQLSSGGRSAHPNLKSNQSQPNQEKRNAQQVSQCARDIASYTSLSCAGVRCFAIFDCRDQATTLTNER